MTMNRSPYLAQALQQLQQPPPAPQAVGPDLSALAALGKRAQAYRAANPGGNFVGHNLAQAGRNLVNAPSNAAHGLAEFARSLPGMSPSPSPGGVKQGAGATPPAVVADAQPGAISAPLQPATPTYAAPVPGPQPLPNPQFQAPPAVPGLTPMGAVLPLARLRTALQ
jgi:hypothetical protein